jgi:hypothetical protein
MLKLGVWKFLNRVSRAAAINCAHVVSQTVAR